MKKTRLLMSLIILTSLFYAYDLNGASPFGEQGYVYIKVKQIEGEGVKGVKVEIPLKEWKGKTDGNGEVKIKKALFEDGEEFQLTIVECKKNLVCYIDSTKKETTKLKLEVNFKEVSPIVIPLINKSVLKERKKSQEEITKLKKDIQSLKKQAEKANQIIKDLKNKGGNSSQELVKINKAISKAASEEISKKQEQLTSITSLNVKLGAQVKGLKASKTTLKKQLDDAKKSLQKTEEKLESHEKLTESEIKRLETEAAFLKRESAWREKELGEEKQKLEIANVEIKNLQGEITKLQDEIKKLKAKNKTQRETYQQKIKELKQASEIDSTTIAEQKLELQKKVLEIAKLDTTVERERNLVKVLKEDTAELNKNIIGLEANLKSISMELRITQTTLQAMADNIKKAAENFYQTGGYDFAREHYEDLLRYDIFSEEDIEEEIEHCRSLQKKVDLAYESFKIGNYENARKMFKDIVYINDTTDKESNQMLTFSIQSEKYLEAATNFFDKGDYSGAESNYRTLLYTVRLANFDNEKVEYNFYLSQRVRKMMNDASNHMKSGQYDLAIKLYEEVEQVPMRVRNLRKKIEKAKDNLNIIRETKVLKERGGYESALTKLKSLNYKAFLSEINQLEVLNELQIEARAFEGTRDIKNTISGYIALNEEHDTQYTRSKVTEQLEAVIKKLNNFKGQSDEEIQASTTFYNRVITNDEKWIQTTFYTFCKKYNVQDGGKEITEQRYAEWLYTIGYRLYNRRHIVQGLRYGQQQKLAKGYLYMASKLGLLKAQIYWDGTNKRNFEPKIYNSYIQNIKLYYQDISNID